MPYEKRSDLPPPVKDNMPDHAQDIFLAAYNSAYEDYDEKTDGNSREVYANSVAWASVKRNFRKNDAGDWVEKKKEVTKTVAGESLPTSAFLVVENPEAPSTWHLQVCDAAGNLDHRLMGASWAALHQGYRGNKYEGPGKQDAIARLKKLYEEEEMPLPAGGKECEADEAEDEKAGRRLRGDKVGILEELKGIFESAKQKVAELLGWAQYEDEEEEPSAMPFDTQSGWQMTKALDGRPLLVVWSTNAFEDREKEIFKTKALADYIDYADKSGRRGTIDFWHVPGTDFATVKEQAMVGRFLVEVAEFDDSAMGQAFKAFLMRHPRGHDEIAPRGWGASPQYRYDPSDRADGVYERMRKEKTSVLPAHKAANVWNPQPEVYGMDDEKKKALEAILGAEKTAELIAQGESLTKELEAQGVAFKAEPEPAPQETPPQEAPPAEQPATEQKEEPAAPVPTPDIAAQLAPTFTAIAEGLAAIGARLTALEAKAAEPPPAVEEKAEPEPTPFDSFAALIRASVIGSKEAQLDKRTREGRALTAGPAQTVGDADGPTPIPFINEIISGKSLQAALGVPMSEE